MDSTADDDPAGELLTLTRQLRGQLSRHAALGSWAAPGAASERPVIDPADLQDSAGVPDVVDEDALMARPGRRTLAQLREEVGNCTRCKLHSTRRELVFGVGAEDAPLMFVGEAPGEQEDRRGEPFVGPAGELLDKMIEAMGWTRQSVYITNILMSRPPNNRDPQPDEVAACLPFLHAKIATIAPRIIVALGRPSANTLLETDAPIGVLRGKFHAKFGVKVMPTFHPAYLLREPTKKRDTWDDLKLVVAELQRLGIQSPNKPRT
ncbi:MAG TPA: uracil-DNA glycosylase [Kofleriaceae bacterium]|jgi:DNA polymerase